MFDRVFETIYNNSKKGDNMENNLFEYATKELSQDAFLCYLLAFGKDKKSLLYPVARNILNNLTIRDEVQNIIRQYEKIDVLILTEKHAIIIEDKINTGLHDNQIEIYESKIHKKYPNLKVIVVYVKTGFLSGQELRSLQKYKQLYKDRFFILTGQDLLNYIGSSELYNDLIIKQWTEFQEQKQKEIQQAKEKIIRNLHSIIFKDLSSELERQIYLDTLTNHIRENTEFKNSSWWIANGRTSHIELLTCNIQDAEKKIEYSTSVYIMFTDNSFSLTIKQHIFMLNDKYDRIKPKNYSAEMKLHLKQQREKMYFTNNQYPWKWQEKDKELKISNLMVLEKKFPVGHQIIHSVISATLEIKLLLEMDK